MRRYEIRTVDPPSPLGIQPVSECYVEADSYEYDVVTSTAVFYSPTGVKVATIRNVLSVLSLENEGGMEVARLELALATETSSKRVAEDARDSLARTVAELRRELADMARDAQRHSKWAGEICGLFGGCHYADAPAKVRIAVAASHELNVTRGKLQELDDKLDAARAAATKGTNP